MHIVPKCNKTSSESKVVWIHTLRQSQECFKLKAPHLDEFPVLCEVQITCRIHIGFLFKDVARVVRLPGGKSRTSDDPLPFVVHEIADEKLGGFWAFRGGEDGAGLRPAHVYVVDGGVLQSWSEDGYGGE